MKTIIATVAATITMILSEIILNEPVSFHELVTLIFVILIYAKGEARS